MNGALGPFALRPAAAGCKAEHVFVWTIRPEAELARDLLEKKEIAMEIL